MVMVDAVLSFLPGCTCRGLRLSQSGLVRAPCDLAIWQLQLECNFSTPRPDDLDFLLLFITFSNYCHSLHIISLNMVRQKQATPLRREHSSEYTVGTPSKLRRSFFEDDAEEIHENVSATSNGHTNGTIVASATLPPVAVQPLQKRQAGLLELVIGVSGIYTSL